MFESRRVKSSIYRKTTVCWRLLSVWCLLGIGDKCHGLQDYCKSNTFATNHTYMQFTKETSFHEYAPINGFKALHCCAKGYHSIEWMKDGKPYPWPDTHSHMILFPANANQTIYTNRVTLEDTGNYTCLLRNETVLHSHTIQLTVFEKNPDDPKITYLSQNMIVPVGGKLRLFCEAFADLVDLPDARNEISWYKIGGGNQSNSLQEKVSREGGRTYGTYLIIEEMRQDDFGEYICQITKPGNRIEKVVHVGEDEVKVLYVDPNPVPVGKLLLIMSAVTFILMAVIILNIHYGLAVRVRIKDTFGNAMVVSNGTDGKHCDVLVVYSDVNANAVHSFLLPMLQDKLGYTCATCMLTSSATTWPRRVDPSLAASSRRIVAVLSPAALLNSWCYTSVFNALKTLHAAWGGQLTCVTLEPPPAQDKHQLKSADSGETLASLQRRMHVLCWQPRSDNDDRFWLSLRLRLPPRRRSPSKRKTSPAEELAYSSSEVNDLIESASSLSSLPCSADMMQRSKASSSDSMV